MRWYAEQRMKWIGERIKEVGHINRLDLQKEFGISTPQASLDLKKFMELNPGLIRYNPSKKAYEFIAHPLACPLCGRSHHCGNENRRELSSSQRGS